MNAKVKALFDHRYANYDDWQSDDKDGEYYIPRPKIKREQNKAMSYLLALQSLEADFVDELFARIENDLPTIEKQEVDRRTRLERLEGLDSEPDYGHWMRCESWTLEEAVALAVGKDPEVLTAHRAKSLGQKHPISGQFLRLLDLAERWAGANNIEDAVLPAEFVTWLRSKQLFIAPNFDAAIKNALPSANDIVAVLRAENEALKAQVEKTGSYASALRLIAGIAIKKYKYRDGKNSGAALMMSKAMPGSLRLSDDTILKILKVAWKKHAEKCHAAISENPEP